MSLANDILALRGRVLGELNAAHDYYTDSKIAWHLIRRVIKPGHSLTIRNRVTGTVTTHPELAGKAGEYVASQLAKTTFQEFVSIFENYFFDLLRLWLVAYPQSLSGKQLEFKAVLAAPDKDAITLHVVNKELNEIMYERPRDWFAYLESRMRLGCPTAEEIEALGEAKASRDVLVHNRGIANKVYESKAGNFARYKDGQKLEIPEPYHRATWQLLRKIVTDVSAAAIAKTA